MHRKRVKQLNKRGLSEVITNLLIIVLVLVAIGVVWIVIRNILNQGASNIEIGQFTFSLNIISAYVNDTGVVVAAKRNIGGGNDFLGINFIFNHAGSNSIQIKKLGFIQEGGTKIFIFTAAEIPGIGGGDEVSIYPIYNSTGKEKIGAVTDTETIAGTGQPIGGGTTCPDNRVEAGETCDDGNIVAGDGCSPTCQTETPASCNNNNQIDSGEVCDGTALGGETCQSQGYSGGTLLCNSNCGFDTSQCTTQQGAVCGNNIVEAGEQCDGTNLNGQSCTSQGFSGSPLTCNPAGGTNACQFNTSQCSPPIAFCGDGTCNVNEDPLTCSIDCPLPETCNGVWEGASENPAVECDGTPTPHGCNTICTCSKGFTNNSAGGCDLNPPLNTGIILTIWPDGAVKYFDSNDLPKDNSVSTYQGDYVNFSNSPETRCLQITFAEYLSENNRAYLRTSSVSSIATGQGYSVWEAENCGQIF